MGYQLVNEKLVSVLECYFSKDIWNNGFIRILKKKKNRIKFNGLRLPLVLNKKKHVKTVFSSADSFSFRSPTPQLISFGLVDFSFSFLGYHFFTMS